MRKSNHHLLRDVLRSLADGATIRTLAERTGVDSTSICASLRTMPDAYIDRWELGNRRWASVWRVVEVPEHCPKPKPEGKRIHSKAPQRVYQQKPYQPQPCALQDAWRMTA